MPFLVTVHQSPGGPCATDFMGTIVVSLDWVVLVGRWMLERNAFRVVDGSGAHCQGCGPTRHGAGRITSPHPRPWFKVRFLQRERHRFDRQNLTPAGISVPPQPHGSALVVLKPSNDRAN
jgi:hypothetical protein